MNRLSNVVFGAGLIGGYLAGALMVAGLPTKLVARERTRKAMANGLTISDLQGNSHTLPCPEFVDIQSQSNLIVDVLWLTVKCTAISTVLDELKALINPNTLIVCCQNGFGSDLIVKRALPDNEVIQAIFGSNVAEPKAGHLHRSTDGRLVVQRSHNGEFNDMASKLNSAHLPVHISDEIEAEQWAKLQLNLGNPVNALANIPIKAMLETHNYRKVLATLMLELLAVTDKLGIELPKVSAVPGKWLPRILKLPDFLFLRLGQKMLAVDETARSSTWWDLQAHKLTEIDFINGALVSKANEIGVSCPANTAIVNLVHECEVSDDEATISAEKMLALIATSNSPA